MLHTPLHLYECVDLQRYPIDQLDSPAGQALIASCRRSLSTTSACQLDGFLLPGAIHAVLDAAAALRDTAWTADQSHNVYFTPVPETFASDDPHCLLQRSRQHAIAYDLLPDELPLVQLYRSAEMTAFIAAALGREQLYPSIDPLDAVDISMFTPGDELGWHFDNSEFSVTLMLQPASAGGHFDYVPHLRQADNEHEAEIAAFLNGTSAAAPIQLRPAAGTLSLFQGHLALHRVSPVEGERTRINAVLTYGDRPDMQLTEMTRLLFYGRLS